MNTTHALAALLAIAAAAAAQVAPPPLDVSARLHAARLREVLDLDVQGAIAEYRAIANERNSRERWIAVARLAELQRIGIPISQPPAVAEAPQAIKAALALLTPLPVEELLRNATSPAAAGAAEAPVLDLHAATLEAQRWVRSKSGPSFNDRQQQRAATMRNRIDESRNDTARIDRLNATDIVRWELEGKADRAAGLRDLYFRTWRPPTTNLDPQATLARIRANLEAWLKEPNQSTQQQQVLGRLRDEIDQRAANDVEAALRLVARLPIYAERLLAEPGK